jgi:hypothetical protein
MQMLRTPAARNKGYYFCAHLQPDTDEFGAAIFVM